MIHIDKIDSLRNGGTIIINGTQGSKDPECSDVYPLFIRVECANFTFKWDGLEIPVLVGPDSKNVAPASDDDIKVLIDAIAAIYPGDYVTPYFNAYAFFYNLLSSLGRCVYFTTQPTVDLGLVVNGIKAGEGKLKSNVDLSAAIVIHPSESGYASDPRNGQRSLKGPTDAH
jgi:hypothetical protein